MTIEAMSTGGTAPTLAKTPSVPTPKLFDLSGQTAVVTGGTRGIGAAVAIGLAESGANVILIQRNDSETKTRDACRKLGRKSEVIICDLADLDRVRKVWSDVDELAGKWGRPVDILVQAGGIQRRAPAVDFAEKDWDEVMDVNLKTVWLLSQAAGRGMVSRGYGRIVLYGSLLTFQGGITVPAYAAAKGALGSLVKALSNEWSSANVLCNAIAPGYIATDMNEALLANPARFRQLSDRIPAGRWGDPDDFKGPTVFLSSPAAQYVSGHVLLVDGGWMGR